MRRHPQNPIVTPNMIVPSDANLVVQGVLNPGAVQVGDEIILLLRVAESCKTNEGTISVPFYRFEKGKGQLEILQVDSDDAGLIRKDNRAVVYKGQEYVSTVSHLRLAKSTDGVNFTVDETPFWVPHNPSEEFGVEDARIVAIEGYYYVNYTAVSKDSYGTSLLRTNDFDDIEYLGMIFCVPNKDVCIFPEKIGGKYMALHRPYNHDFGRSSIWIAESPDLLHWGNHRCLIRPRKNGWEDQKIGGGAPPIRTKYGWLEVYHGKTLIDGKDSYSLMVLLLDLEDPTQVIYRSAKPILIPEMHYEKNGFVPNVIFLNGMLLQNHEDLLLYYSTCDEMTCLAQYKLEELISI